MMCDANQCHEPCCAKQALLFIHVSQDCAMLPLMTHASHAKVETPRVENRKRVYQVHVFFLNHNLSLVFGVGLSQDLSPEPVPQIQSVNASVNASVPVSGLKASCV